jgi:hypothetical protein
MEGRGVTVFVGVMVGGGWVVAVGVAVSVAVGAGAQEANNPRMSTNEMVRQDIFIVFSL